MWSLKWHNFFYLSVVEQGLPEDALVAQKPATTALKHGLICILINFKILFHLLSFNFHTSTLSRDIVHVPLSCMHVAAANRMESHGD